MRYHLIAETFHFTQNLRQKKTQIKNTQKLCTILFLMFIDIQWVCSMFIVQSNNQL